MKKKTIIISFLLIVIVVLAIPVAGFLFMAFYPLKPETKGKICEAIKIIDLKNLPEGHFQKVSIGDDNYIIFEVPADKMAEFEAGFRECVPNAMPLKGILGCLSPKLRIQAEKGKYSAYICYDDDGVTIYSYDIFHRGFGSMELRKVFYDAGLKYGSEKQPAQEIEKEPINPDKLVKAIKMILPFVGSWPPDDGFF